MLKINRYNKFALILISSWLSMSMLIDFIVVPNIFKMSKNIFDSGDLGIFLFSLLNRLEIVISLLLFFCLFQIAKRKRNPFLKRINLSLGTLLVTISITYTFYLSPKISYYGTQMKKLTSATEYSIDFEKAQLSHHFYHQSYKMVDGIKILTLIFLLALTFKNEMPVPLIASNSNNEGNS